LAYDPSFSTLNTYAAVATRKSALIRAFCPPYDQEGREGIEGSHRIHLNVERWKVPEAWFYPGMAGVDCAGLGEIIQNVLTSFSLRERARMANVSSLWVPCPFIPLTIKFYFISLPYSEYPADWWAFATQ